MGIEQSTVKPYKHYQSLDMSPKPGETTHDFKISEHEGSRSPTTEKDSHVNDEVVAKPKPKPQQVPEHHWPVNEEFHTREEVEKSMKDYPWKVVEPYNGKQWVSWDVLGLPCEHEEYNLKWTNCADMSLGWTGLVVLQPGQIEPMHRHTTPMVYYILQGKPIISLNFTKNRTSKWQCINIPSGCPHGIMNDHPDKEEVVIAWCYLPFEDEAKPHPEKNYNWEFLQELNGKYH